MPELNEIALSLDALLSSVDLSKVTSNGPGREELPDGYYLCEFAAGSKLTLTKNTNEPMVSVKFVVLEDGLKSVLDDAGNVILVNAKGTKNYPIYVNYVLKDSSSVKRFVSDMLKFEMPENPGEPILGEEYFKSTALLAEAIACLETSRIYVNVQSYDKGGEKKQRVNLVKWDRAKDLDLPM